MPFRQYLALMLVPSTRSRIHHCEPAAPEGSSVPVASVERAGAAGVVDASEAEAGRAGRGVRDSGRVAVAGIGLGAGHQPQLVAGADRVGRVQLDQAQQLHVAGSGRHPGRHLLAAARPAVDDGVASLHLRPLRRGDRPAATDIGGTETCGHAALELIADDHRRRLRRRRQLVGERPHAHRIDGRDLVPVGLPVGEPWVRVARDVAELGQEDLLAALRRAVDVVVRDLRAAVRGRRPLQADAAVARVRARQRGRSGDGCLRRRRALVGERPLADRVDGRDLVPVGLPVGEPWVRVARDVAELGQEDLLAALRRAVDRCSS